MFFVLCFGFGFVGLFWFCFESAFGTWFSFVLFVFSWWVGGWMGWLIDWLAGWFAIVCFLCICWYHWFVCFFLLAAGSRWSRLLFVQSACDLLVISGFILWICGYFCVFCLLSGYTCYVW